MGVGVIDDFLSNIIEMFGRLTLVHSTVNTESNTHDGIGLIFDLYHNTQFNNPCLAR